MPRRDPNRSRRLSTFAPRPFTCPYFPEEFPTLPIHKVYFKTPFVNFVHGLVWATKVLEQSPYVDYKGSITAIMAMRRLRRHVFEEYERLYEASEIPPVRLRDLDREEEELALLALIEALWAECAADIPDERYG